MNRNKLCVLDMLAFSTHAQWACVHKSNLMSTGSQHHQDVKHFPELSYWRLGQLACKAAANINRPYSTVERHVMTVCNVCTVAHLGTR